MAPEAMASDGLWIIRALVICLMMVSHSQCTGLPLPALPDAFLIVIKYSLKYWYNFINQASDISPAPVQMHKAGVL